MTKQQILERAISQALDNGWDLFGMTKYDPEYQVLDIPNLPNFLGVTAIFHHEEVGLIEYTYTLHDIIFNHDFARAIWGDKFIPCEECGGAIISVDRIDATHECQGCGTKYDTTDEELGNAWQYHLQQLVIADDPIQYLAESLELKEEQE